jgi:hypothetical protein
MEKTYKIITENNKTNIYYYLGENIELKEFFNGNIKDGYSKKIETLTDYKNYLIDLQDKKTEQLIYSGFTFDNNLFSLSINAQINWSNLLNIPQQMFPINLSTKDDNIYVLDFNNVQNFYFTALGRKNECLQLGNIIKKRINESLTIQELDTIKSEIC